MDINNNNIIRFIISAYLINCLSNLDFQLGILHPLSAYAILGAKSTNVCLREPSSQSTFKLEIIGYLLIRIAMLYHILYYFSVG